MPLRILSKEKTLKKLNERSCLKCNGPLIPESVNTEEGSSRTLRCIVCGEVVDPVILANRWKRDAA
ncbi:MAG TPA: hypothetical protein VGB26_13265 [Nitrospiria bacterium]|jgi:hypothetical protein